MKIERAKLEDAAEILALQKLAFRSQAELYGDPYIPPMIQTLAETEEDIRRQTVLKAVESGRIIGSVRVKVLDDGSHYISRLMVHPDCQNRGIGTALMREVERIFPDALRFELMTGIKSKKNIYLYEKLGYSIFKTERVNEKVTLVYMEKRMEGNHDKAQRQPQ